MPIHLQPFGELHNADDILMEVFVLRWEDEVLALPKRFLLYHLHTIDTEIKVKLILRKYFFAFAFVLILIGQMVFRIHVHIDTSPRISLSLSLS